MEPRQIDIFGLNSKGIQNNFGVKHQFVADPIKSKSYFVKTILDRIKNLYSWLRLETSKTYPEEKMAK